MPLRDARHRPGWYRRCYTHINELFGSRGLVASAMVSARRGRRTVSVARHDLSGHALEGSMSDTPTPRDLDDKYVHLIHAIAAEASAGLISRDRATAIGDAIEREWRTNRWEAVQRGLTRQIAELEEAHDPRYAGVIRMMTGFRDDPRGAHIRA